MKINFNELLEKEIADILIVTATDVETHAVHQKMKPVCNDGLLEISDKNFLYTAGVLGGYNVIHCQCSHMGTENKGGSYSTIVNALQTWPSINAVFMVGIAFGMYDDSSSGQKYSDVLVSEKIIPYEYQKINSNGDITYRESQGYSANKDFVDAFSVVKRTWERKNLDGENTAIEICPILSGEKLIDNIKARNDLKNTFSSIKARGGEMEGVGLASACEECGKPWILIKAICDFADGNKSEHKCEKQKDAADAAVIALISALKVVNVSNVIGERINFFYRNSSVDISDVFFLHYDRDSALYYLVRTVDKQIQPYVLSKSCWVYGLTGIGKSDLLTRTLMVNGLDYVYVDLSLCSKSDVIDSFQYIYETVCLRLGIEPDDFNDYTHCVKGICSMIKRHYNGSVLYLLIDEIPFDQSSEGFNEFVDKFCSMMTFMEHELGGIHVLVMLSSIASPKDSINTDARLQKVSQQIKFIELQRWTEEECCKLISLLSNAVHLSWEDISHDIFAKEFDYSPRLIKNALKEACSLGYRVINKEIVERLKEGKI